MVFYLSYPILFILLFTVITVREDYLYLFKKLSLYGSTRSSTRPHYDGPIIVSTGGGRTFVWGRSLLDGGWFGFFIRIHSLILHATQTGFTGWIAASAGSFCEVEDPCLGDKVRWEWNPPGRQCGLTDEGWEGSLSSRDESDGIGVQTEHWCESWSLKVVGSLKGPDVVLK